MFQVLSRKLLASTLALALLPLSGAVQAAEAGAKINAMHVLGSHNSYRPALDADSLAYLRTVLGDRSAGVEYGHPAIAAQLDLGLRQLEFDPYADSQGGRFAGAYASDPARFAVMSAPGAKVLHVPVVDARTHCLTLTNCFTQVADWSSRHPDHAMIVLFVNTKDDSFDNPALPKVEPFTDATLSEIDRSAIAAFGRDHLVTPDDVRGDFTSLREAVKAGHWPTQTSARGKVLLILDSGPATAGRYREAHPSLKGRVMFGLYDAAEPEAAVFNIQNPKTDEARIRDLVAQGFLVRTRSDADTKEARTHDLTRLEAAVRSGAQIISTDYYAGAPDPLDLKFVVGIEPSN